MQIERGLRKSVDALHALAKKCKKEIEIQKTQTEFVIIAAIATYTNQQAHRIYKITRMIQTQTVLQKKREKIIKEERSKRKNCQQYNKTIQIQ